MTIALIILVGGYLLICAALYFYQEHMLFPGIDRPKGAVEAPAGVRVDRLQLADGTSYRVAIAEPEKPRGVLVYYVGNGEDLRSGARWAALFAGYGLQTLVTEYPGYGESGGYAGYGPILAAAEASARKAKEWSTAKKLPLFVAGHSLGSFSAVHVAAQGLGDRMLLVSPPTSIAAAGSSRYPFLPIRMLLRHPFDNLAQAGKVAIPALILHGDADTVVPIEMGRTLAKTLGKAQLVEVPGRGHNDIDLARSGPFGDRIEQHLFQ